MISHTARDFDALEVIEVHLVTPTIVTTGGLLGRFDTLRVALEHLLTHGTAHTVLAIQTPGEELQFSEGGLDALLDRFARWLEEAGLANPMKGQSEERSGLDRQ